MSVFSLKPTHKPVKAYFDALATFEKHGHTTEGNTRSAFADLLKKCASAFHWHLVEEYQFKGTAKQPLRADGALVDDLTLVHGLWEAKDTADDLQREIKSKVAKGYPLTNILFQSPSRAVLYQDNRIAFDADITAPEKLIEVLQLFCEHKQAHEVDWETAVTKFAEKIPELAGGVTKILIDEDLKNPAFRQNFQSFAELCRQSINPDLTDDSIRKMLVQHLLTARIFIKVFKNEEFLRRNVIAAEIEKVIDSITSRYFSRNEFLKPLDRFYTAIEKAAESQEGYTEKQHFLNAVYEKFFQRFDTKQADTHGIVYTPQPIVDFMVRSVEEILQQEFGKTLSDSGVHILDPFTGTGNFITRVMQQIKRSALPQKYAEELHCNEIMLLPYYIASMNIEQAYMSGSGQYRPFEGICLADTFDLRAQVTIFAEQNTARIAKQRKTSIEVIIGNPPYNAWQVSENDNNKNRRYEELDIRVAETYVRSSMATNKNAMSDPYIKAFRWATDRVGEEGVIAFVTNNGFLDSLSADGFRKHLAMDFDSIYILDLGGNIRRNPNLSGTTHNVFGIQVGVCITFLVRRKGNRETRIPSIKYQNVGASWKREQKYGYLNQVARIGGVDWTTISPSDGHHWLNEGHMDDFKNFTSIEHIFLEHGRGVMTCRDNWVYNFQKKQLEINVAKSIAFYNKELERWQTQTESKNTLDAFVSYDETNISWSRDMKSDIARDRRAVYSPLKIREAVYRPFVSKYLFFDRVFNEEVYQLPSFLPANRRNKVIWLKVGSSWPMFALATEKIPDVLPEGGSQCFPFYRYEENGTEQKQNIPNAQLQRFRLHYGDQTITKADIFHAAYAVLHHPEYRTRYAANLKRELPRIPFPPDLHAFAAAGKRLMDLHIDYEKQDEYRLEQIEHPTNEVTHRVERMKLSKDKTELRYNDFLTLRGIPAAAFDYRLGNRSALEWVVDQYRVSTDTRSGIVNDPNRADDPKYILRLIGQVITVSLETQQIIAAMPSLNLPST